MTFSLPKVGRRNAVLFTTLLLILAAFAYYFLVYVQTNESRFIDRAYRVLDRKSQNIQNKYDGYQNYLGYIYRSVDEEIEGILTSGKNQRAEMNWYQEKIYDLYDSANLIETLSNSKRSSGGDQVKLKKIYREIDLYENRIQKLRSGFYDRVNERIVEVLESSAPKNVRLDYYDQGEYFYQSDKFLYDGNDFSWFVKGEDGTIVSFSESAETFTSDVLTNGFFDEYILLKEGDLYGDVNDDSNYAIVHQTFRNPIDLISISPLLQSPHEKDLHSDSVYMAMGPRMIRPTDVDLYNNGYKLLFHRMEINEETYFLGGFVKSTVFRKESQKVEVFLLVLSILLILLLVISMPMLKLMLMSSIERLHIRNVMMGGVSIVLGIPVVLLIIFSLYEFVLKGNQEIDKDLSELSDDIETSFIHETLTMVKLLNKIDSTVAVSPEGLKTMDLTAYNEFNHIFWIKRDGYTTENLQRTLFLKEAGTIDVSGRDYFKKIVNDEAWKLRFDSATAVKYELKKDTSFDFYLQSIISWSDFTREAAISIPSRLSHENDLPVAAMTSQLGSVMDAILPAGYGFAIIDQDGLVKFHNIKDRVLQENFLEETNQSAEIRAAIYSRVATNADIKYRNVNHRAYIQPINSMPLYLVTFYNTEYRNVEIQGVISISIILLFGSFAAVCLMMVILNLIQKRRSKLKIKTFLLHWIKPEEEKAGIYQFLSLLFFAIGAFLLLMIAIPSVNETDILFNFIITNAYLFLISFMWLSPKESTRYTERPSERRNFNIAFIVFIIAADWSYIPFADVSYWWIAYQILLVGFLFFNRFFEGAVRNGSIRLPDFLFLGRSIKYHSYNIFLFSWLMISSILPIFFIFMVAHNEEEIIWQKYNQLKIADQYRQKVRVMNDKLEPLKEDSALRESFFLSKLKSGQYLLNSTLTNSPDSIYRNCAEGITRADYMLSMIRPHYSDMIIESKGLTFDLSQERNRRWCFPNVDDKSSIQLVYLDNFGPENRSDYQQILIKSRPNLLLFGQGQKSNKAGIQHFRSFFFSIVLLILIGVYVLIDYCVNKIYGREYTNFKNTLPLTVENFKRISIGDDSITHHKQRQIFLLGLPKSNKSNLIKTLEGNFLDADMMLVNNKVEWEKLIDADYKKYDGVIIENFEYGVSSHLINQKRLKLLEKLTSHHGHQLVISSNVHPSFITEFYENKILKFKGEEDVKEELNCALETWRHVLGGFIIVHNPIKENSKINSYLKPSWIKSDVFKQLFRMELNKGSFLPNLLPGIKDYFVKLKENAGGDESKIDKEDIILRIQLLAESYYLGLWNTLSKEEKYIIYDLAKDRFVNINNKNGIRSLLEKGLLIYENELRIMNESFTNFVLSIIKKGEALTMEKEVRDKGTWSTVSAVLGLTLLGILAFLFLGNPDFFQDFNAMISVLIAIASVVPRLGGLTSFAKASSGGETG
jgi:hypothetical protein